MINLSYIEFLSHIDSVQSYNKLLSNFFTLYLKHNLTYYSNYIHNCLNLNIFRIDVTS